VDEAREEVGAVSSFDSVTDEIAAGQWRERREVFEAIRYAIEVRRFTRIECACLERCL
jgi:hypothetical protein